MKRIKCPHCNHPVLKTIGLRVEGDCWYYIEKHSFGAIGVPYYWNGIIPRNKKYILAFYCRHCGKAFPESMKKKIFHWLKLKRILQKLTQ